MGFGKRSLSFGGLTSQNNFERSYLPSTRLLKSNWVVRPFIYGMHPIPREWTV